MKPTKITIKTPPSDVIKEMMLHTIPNGVVFKAKHDNGHAGEEELFAKFGGVVICLTRPSFFRSVDSSRFFDVKLMKEMVIWVR